MRTQGPPRNRGRQVAGAVGALLLVVALLLLAPYLVNDFELVRLRNALSLGPDVTAAQDWTPDRVPEDFRLEQVAADPYFVEIGRQLGLERLPDDWARAVAISRHLLVSAGQLNGGAVQRDLRTTHQAIVERGDGYCGDFVRVFTAIANAAGMQVRPWAFAFDGFGGHGHILVDVWNRQASRWQFVDVFNNHYVTRADGQPLSALELKRTLAFGHDGLYLRRLDPNARSYDIEAKFWDYYERGLSQWFAPWGNNVQTVDAGWPTRVFSGVSRVLEQGGSILAGFEPEVRLLAEPANEAQRAALRSLQSRVAAAGVLGVIGLVLLTGALVWRPRREPIGRRPLVCGRMNG